METVAEAGPRGCFNAVPLRSLSLPAYPRYVQECRLEGLDSGSGAVSC